MGIFPRLAQTERQKAVTNEYEKRNFRLAVISGILVRISFRFVDSTMVLAAFVKQLTGSNVMVGLVSSTMRAGWMWPQLLISNMLEHRPRKMPFYYVSFVVRIASWGLIVLSVLLLGGRNSMLLFYCFYVLYFLGSSGVGIGTLPFNDIIAKSIPVSRRARLFSLRSLWGGVFSIGAGFVIGYILSDEFRLPFPYDYALMFGISTLMRAGSSICFMMSKEPIQPVRDSRRPFWQHLKRGPHFLKTDPDYRRFLVFRITSTFAGMSIPFYIPYALDHIGISESLIGWYTAVGATSAVLSNLLWVYVGDKHGSRTLLIIFSILSCVAPIIPLSAGYIHASQQTIFYSLVFILTQALINARGIGYMTYSLNLAPSLSRPTYLGFLNTLMFPMSFVPVLSGWLSKAISYESIFIISIIASVLTIYFALSLSNVDERDDIESKDDG